MLPGYFSEPETDNGTVRYQQSACPAGYYCEGGVRQPCPGGRFGNASALPSWRCSGECWPGYYCESGSQTPTQFECGSSAVYCPAGSERPLTAVPGEMTVGWSQSTRNSSERCPEGHYCVDGEPTVCPAGQFGCARGLWSEECNGKCAAGFYCPAGSRSNSEYACGNSSVYCPEGSGAPLIVGAGNYSLGGPTSMRNSAQAVCPTGSYCVNGSRVSRSSRHIRGWEACLAYRLLE